MEEAIQALSDVIRELNETVEALPEMVASKVAEAVEAKLAETGVLKDAPGSNEVTEAEMKTIVTDAVSAAFTAKTGALPD